ncbi:MAG: hypothetical protein M0Z94_20840 [Dehalococcoidales bacterium]|nr:hypothetical protein [Dehalococcoidales bacterium]
MVSRGSSGERRGEDGALVASGHRRQGFAAAILGLVLSGLLVAAAGYGVASWAGADRQAEMGATYQSLPPYEGATFERSEERWENLLVYWQSEGVLPRIVGYYRSEDPISAVLSHYKECLLANGWEEYHEPWSLYPTYRRGPYHIAILFQYPYAQDWLPAQSYQVHLWSQPLLEELLGRSLAGAAN